MSGTDFWHEFIASSLIRWYPFSLSLSNSDFVRQFDSTLQKRKSEFWWNILDFSILRYWWIQKLTRKASRQEKMRGRGIAADNCEHTRHHIQITNPNGDYGLIEGSYETLIMSYVPSSTWLETARSSSSPYKPYQSCSFHYAFHVMHVLQYHSPLNMYSVICWAHHTF